MTVGGVGDPAVWAADRFPAGEGSEGVVSLLVRRGRVGSPAGSGGAVGRSARRGVSLQGS
ncbi:hypothetical protein [Nocardia sp. NPDC060259]|uniref:hypothetical protein n=1 Tax=Nocardia sp. NPDC060259 TaxID=3347088 RepID=UPI00364F6BD3